MMFDRDLHIVELRVVAEALIQASRQFRVAAVLREPCAIRCVVILCVVGLANRDRLLAPRSAES
jgi:hypothetical protein